ncbi:MAG: CRISPR system precrRNA processing endoribonuclease RAMP protein Cas6 [Cardiobacteriaceae bacterium]|nr:CRISPR system precrRNA processing endoribonuclease RAMP protein Cas6 [Cardiobacteriaceae bacterium]
MNHNILALPDELPIARYRYTFTITRTLRAPVYAGSALRGAFGHALRRASVPRAHKIVPELLASSPYAQLFEPAPRPDIGLANPATIPPPYLIEPVAFGESRDYLPGSRYQFDMVLLGQARHYLPLISYAWQQAFRGRDGIAHGQGELADIAIERDNHWYSIYDGERVEEHANTIRLPSETPNTLTLHLRTPLRLQQNGTALGTHRIDAQTLLTHMLRRLSLVCQLHFNLTPQADFAALKARAAEVESHHDLHWHDWTRYSNRQKQSMQLGGLMGHWHLANLTPEHSRALQIGQWLHLGKNTTFGLGRYTLDTPHA